MHTGKEHRRTRLRALMAASLLWLVPTLACGSFAPRPTPTPTLETALVAPTDTPTPVSFIDQQSTPLPADVATNTPEPTATSTPPPVSGTAIAVGQPARVVAANGLNLRTAPNTNGELLLRLPPSTKVTVIEGPTDAEGFRWWRVDDGQGNVGWVAENDGETELLSPQLGVPEPVDRAPRVGERVRVTMEASGGQLSVRVTPGTDAEVVERVNPGQEFTVMGGPQASSGYTWYQIRSDDGTVEGWAAEGDGTERWLSPLE